MRPEELEEIFLQIAIFKQLTLMLDAEQIEYLLSLPPDRRAVYLSFLNLTPSKLSIFCLRLTRRTREIDTNAQ